MSVDWQNVIVILAIGMACAYLARILWLSIARRRTAACASCDNCSSARANEPTNLVGIEPLTATAKLELNEEV